MSLRKDRKASFSRKAFFFRMVPFSLRDLKMARFLSSALHRSDLHNTVEGKSGVYPKDIECPSLEDIAAFMDGHLSSKERDKILYHLNRCNDCYELFSEALKTKTEIEKDEVRGTGHPLWKGVIPYAIAASLVFMLIYAVYFSWMRSHYDKDSGVDPFGFPLMAKRITLLGEDMQGETSPFLFGRYQDTGYGFGGSGLSLKNRLFIFGVYQTDLELSLVKEDREKALATLLAIDSLLKDVESLLKDVEHVGQVEQSEQTEQTEQAEQVKQVKQVKQAEQLAKIIEFYHNLQQKIKKPVPLSHLAGAIDKPWFDDPVLIIYPRFGQWVEAGRIASLTMNGKALKAKEAGFFIDKLTDKGLPHGVMRSLQTIGDILGKGTLEERDFNRMGKEFNNILLVNF